MRLRQPKVCLLIILAVLSASCSPTKPGPVVDLAIQSVTPSAGPATGGTEVTIRGTGFAAGATITIGGRPGTDVRVSGSDVVMAKTPASAIAGPVDVVVSVNGRTNTMAGGFRYETVGPNTPPVVRSISAQGRRLRQPPAYADYGEAIAIAVVVQDAESTATQLQYQWQQTCSGTFNGTGPQVEWTAPAMGTLPSRCTIQVTVTDGPHVANSSIEIRLHNSVVEVGALALEFLTEFANSTIPAETTVRNFSNSCAGKAAELKDVMNNRATRIINSYVYGTPAVTVVFGGVCKSKTVDACAITSVEWNSTIKPGTVQENVKGISTITGIYRDSRWWLCDSLFDGASSLGLHFMH